MTPTACTDAFREAAERASIRRPDGDGTDTPLVEAHLRRLETDPVVPGRSRCPSSAARARDLHGTRPLHYTAYYLTATPELMALAAERAHHHVTALEDGDEG